MGTRFTRISETVQRVRLYPNIGQTIGNASRKVHETIRNT